MFESRDLRTIGDAIAELAAELDRRAARLLVLIAEFDRRRGWEAWGMKSCADWLAWRCGVTHVTARDHVRIARALTRLPLLAAAFSAGDLSFSKVRALTRIATAGDEALWLERARSRTAAQLDAMVHEERMARAAADPLRRHRRRSLSFFHDDDGCVVMRARLEPEVGAVVMAVIDQIVAASEPSDEDASAEAPDGDDSPPWEQARADALEQLALAYRAGSDGDRGAAGRALLLIHTDGDVASGRVDRGPRLAPDTLRRLACDATLVQVRQTPEPTVGPRSRTIPRTVRRALRLRDRGCRFPGCRARRVDAHHVRHWADGGPSTLANLLLLCRQHHRLVHELGFSIADAGGRWTFRTPDGAPIEEAPNPAGQSSLRREEVCARNENVFYFARRTEREVH